MGFKTVVGIILLTLGVLGLIYGGFSYTSEEHAVNLGPVELGVEEKERVDVPLWASITAVVLGAGTIVWSRSDRRVAG